MRKNHPITFVIEEAPRDAFDPEAGSYFRIVRKCADSKRVYGQHVAIEDALDHFDRMMVDVATRPELCMVERDLHEAIGEVDENLTTHAGRRKHGR